jgi:hypothetical protein
MPRVIEKTVFTFDELDESAKERAREWYRQTMEFDDVANIEDWTKVAEILGIEFSTHPVRLMNGATRQQPDVWWSVGWTQGDGASFYGQYAYAAGAPKKIRAYAPKDKELHRIADRLQALQRPRFYRLSARISRHHGGGHYVHSRTMSVSVFDGDIDARLDDQEEIAELMRDFADWIYDQVRSEIEWRLTDEQVDEAIRANQYEFWEDGRRACLP